MVLFQVKVFLFPDMPTLLPHSFCEWLMPVYITKYALSANTLKCNHCAFKCTMGLFRGILRTFVSWE